MNYILSVQMIVVQNMNNTHCLVTIILLNERRQNAVTYIPFKIIKLPSKFSKDCGIDHVDIKIFRCQMYTFNGRRNDT